MGKISDALERQRHEKTIKTKRLHPVADINEEQLIQGDFDPKLVVCSAPGSLEADNFKVLKGRILFSDEKSTPRTILVTSTFPSEGKTFVAANLAVSLAQGLNVHALLIDCDFRRPRVHKMLGYSNEKGLHDYLTDNRELQDLLIRTDVEKLSLLTAGSASKNPSELLSSKMMKDLFEELKSRYNDRYIVIDTAPAHVVSEINILSRYVDGIIFVVMAGKTPIQVAKKCIENLGKEKIIGIVFNGHKKAYNSYDKYYKNYYTEK